MSQRKPLQKIKHFYTVYRPRFGLLYLNRLNFTNFETQVQWFIQALTDFRLTEVKTQS